MTDAPTYTFMSIANSTAKLVHHDVNGLNIDEVEKKYQAKYVGEFCLIDKSGGWSNFPVSIFYNSVKHPQGSNFFGMYFDSYVGQLYITDGIKAVVDGYQKPVVYTAIEAEDGNLLYSAFRHDYQTYNNVMIDGGRDYCKHNLSGKIKQFYINPADGRINLIET